MRSILFCLVLTGCVSQLLEAPYVLSSGLGEARSVAPTGNNTLLAATSAGVVEVNGEGEAQHLTHSHALAVTAHPTKRYVVEASGLRNLDGDQALERPGIRDAQAWCNDSVLFALADGVWSWKPSTGEVALWADGFEDIRATALYPEAKCESLLVLDGEQVFRVWADQRVVLGRGLHNARSVATDGHGQIYALAGEPRTLLRQAGEEWTTIARGLDHAEDLHFGFGGAFPRENLYIADSGGTLDYLRPPPAPGAPE